MILPLFHSSAPRISLPCPLSEYRWLRSPALKRLLVPLLLAPLALIDAAEVTKNKGAGNYERPEHFFTSPAAPYVNSAEEVLRQVQLPAGPIEAAQSLIDEARKTNPDAYLVLLATGPLLVNAAPLRIGSRMSLRLSPTAGIEADPAISARSLIEIEKAELVSIASSDAGLGLLNGKGKAVVGIRVIESVRVNLDELHLTGCGAAGIVIQGRDAAKMNEACSVTRCQFSANGDGLRVEKSAAFMCLDNTFRQQTGTALSLNSLCSVVAGNGFSHNKTAIQNGSDRGVVTRNVIDDPTALVLTPESCGILVSENRSSAQGQQLRLDGKNHQLFHNEFTGTVTMAPSCEEVLMLENTGLTAPSASAHLKLFNPPTFSTPHKNPLIVAGMGRFDLSVPGGQPIVTESVDPATGKKKTKKDKAIPVDLTVVQEAVDKARTEHPKDVLVLNLDGEYVSKNPTGLKLPPNTCVILKGRIQADLNIPLDPQYVKTAPLTQVVMMPATGFGSFSGGRLDAGHQAFSPINAATNSIALIEGVDLSGGARDGVYTKARSPAAPVFIYRCTISENNGRGIWSHVASRVHSIANTVTGNRMDGIDLDAHSIDGTALFNVSNGNIRHGIFLEEAITHHVVFGNTFSGNGGSGVHVWNEEVNGNTGPNVVAANRCEANGRGLSAGGRDDTKTANENFFFNNVSDQNRGVGIRTGNSHAKNNYFSHSVVWGNSEKEIDTPPSAQGFQFNEITNTEW